VKVVIAGGSGLVGRRLVLALAHRGDRPVVLSRTPQPLGKTTSGTEVVAWDPADPTGRWATSLAGADAVVNLAGASVGKWPWTRGRMRELVASRLGPTSALVDAIAALPPCDRPKVLVNASGTDVYEGQDTAPAFEETVPGETFLSRLCLSWERAALLAEDVGVRVVLTRMSLVVDREAPALERFALPVRLFIGGRLGRGTQWISWIHLDDAIGLMLMAMETEDLAGPLNVASPDPRRQIEFTTALARVLGRPVWLPIPASAVRLALGSQATLALGSRRVSPSKALERGYEFRYPRLEEALAAEIG
jgi:uncharacterized protein (TIGR01777 family)